MLTRKERALAIALIKRAEARRRKSALARMLLKLAKEHEDDEKKEKALPDWLWPEDTTRLRILLYLLGGGLGALGARKLHKYLKRKYEEGLELPPATNYASRREAMLRPSDWVPPNT